MIKNEQRLENERRAFDRQILERVKRGYIPDLRRVKKCAYFYNNSWRHPGYVRLDFGEQFELVNKAIRTHACPRRKPISVLEVGCGGGYLCLELARQGFEVTGIDLSPACIEVARHCARSDPWKNKRGSLTYICADFFAFAKQAVRKFDAVVFLGTLHHFRNQDAVMRYAKRLLSPRGIIVVHEPTRDRVTEGNAAFMHLVELLLSIAGGFYRRVPLPKNSHEYKRQVKKLLLGLKYKDDKGNNIQSVQDNVAGHAKMYRALRKNFIELCYDERSAFFHEIIGGLRFNEKTNLALARYLRDADRYLCSLKVLQSTEFLFIGRRKNT